MAIGLGLVAGAILHAPLGAQQRDTSRTRRDTVRAEPLPPPRDTAARRDTAGAVVVPVPPGPDSLLRRDSLVMRDSLRPPSRDSLLPPIASAEAPTLADPGSFIWDRRDVFSTGALTLQDLLDRVVGATGLRAGWLAQPMVTAYLGDPRRVRIWLDGLELTELDPRADRIWDVTQIPLWALDDIRVERAASEIRIHMRTWRVQRRTPFTRTDVYTGDQGTNLYRGLFGRRYQHGEVLQLAGQQYGTTPGRNAASSDALGVVGRVGWANAGWSIDAFLLRHDRNRGRNVTLARSDSIPALESTRSDAYLRIGWGRTDSAGFWAQGIANASRYTFGGAGSSQGGAVTVDTTRSYAQWVGSAGYRVGPLQGSVTQRLVVGASRRIATPSARVGYETRFLSVSAFGEGRTGDSTRRADLSAVVRPTGFIYLSGAYGLEQPRTTSDSLPAPAFARGEIGLRAGQLWLSGGVLRRGPVLLDAPRILSDDAVARTDDAIDAVVAAVKGRVWKAIYADLQGIRWSDTGGFYRPRFQARSELYVSTRMLDRFPSGNLHILASAVHEYRSSVLWPSASGVVTRLPGYRTLSTLVQVRVIQAEVFWNFRNTLNERYQEVPGYQLPRLVNVYGVRWEFWN